MLMVWVKCICAWFLCVFKCWCVCVRIGWAYVETDAISGIHECFDWNRLSLFEKNAHTYAVVSHLSVLNAKFSENLSMNNKTKWKRKSNLLRSLVEIYLKIRNEYTLVLIFNAICKQFHFQHIDQHCRMCFLYSNFGEFSEYWMGL